MKARMDYPATQRNREPIAEVLGPFLAKVDHVLEVASGTGQHVIYFAHRFPHVRFTPSDPSADARASIAAWVKEANVNNVDAPLDIDAGEGAVPFPAGSLPFIFCANMIHIAPISACHGLLEAAGDALADGGLLALYGPFMLDGQHTAESNARFDEDLKRRNPAWGVRDLADVATLAEKRGLQLLGKHTMPANNFTVLFKRSARP